jgi:hypothetical protein
MTADPTGLTANPSLPAEPTLSALLAREMLAARTLAPQVAARAQAVFAAAARTGGDSRTYATVEALRMVGISARLMDRCLDGIAALGKLGDPGQAFAAALAEPRPRQPTSQSAPRSAAPIAAPPPIAQPLLKNRGRLRHGNPSGDYLAAPRCGARTRCDASCRQPAMKNGRCRLHGGKSTGPRTPAGLARSRRARLIHGARARALLAFRAQANQTARRLLRLAATARSLAATARSLAATARILAGHGVHGSDFLFRFRAPAEGPAATPCGRVPHPVAPPPAPLQAPNDYVT